MRLVNNFHLLKLKISNEMLVTPTVCVNFEQFV